MIEASPYRVPFDGRFDARRQPTRPPADAPGSKACREALAQQVSELVALQQLLYAEGRHALLLIFQALDAAGKDSTIRHLLSGVNPAGCRVISFKRPSAEELAHDFLWRCACRLPERGVIGVFNRSYYEEVLVVRVHPEFLDAQRLPRALPLAELWQERYASIREHEQHLARNGTMVLKFWLNVSRAEQRKRLLDRLEKPQKHWKFDPGDLAERQRWDDYLDAFGEALAATSRPWAPWYAIPADDQPFARLAVAEIVVSALKRMRLSYPELPERDRAELPALRRALEADG
ncbi:polyphosphate kinase 2 family protein [bacterium]|nr:polyphosphate kinase 2 family protein [bacterium]